MGLRPGKCYTNDGLTKDRAYCRVAVTVHERNYIGATPGLKIRQFNMGNPTKHFSHLLNLCIEGRVQIRDNAIESVRQVITRYLMKKLGKDGYFIRIRVYPYHILRENKQAQGAHADRIQKGMSHAFGKPIGRALRTRPGMILLSALVDEASIPIAKQGLLRAKSRLPCSLSIDVRTDVESIGARPRFIREIAETTVVAAEATAEGTADGEAKADGKASGKEAKGGEKGKTADTKAPAGKSDAKGTVGKAEAKGAAPAGKTAGKSEGKKK